MKTIITILFFISFTTQICAQLLTKDQLRDSTIKYYIMFRDSMYANCCIDTIIFDSISNKYSFYRTKSLTLYPTEQAKHDFLQSVFDAYERKRNIKK